MYKKDLSRKKVILSLSIYPIHNGHIGKRKTEYYPISHFIANVQLQQ